MPTASALALAPLTLALLAPATLRAQTPAAEVKDAANVSLMRLNTDGGFLVRGTYGTGLIPAAGAGARLMWHPLKAAFRAGFVDAAQWDEASVGDHSFASGYNTTASAYYSTALGYGTTAASNYSTALGNGTTASGDFATAMGDGTTASGPSSTAMGTGTTASGPSATALGNLTGASGFYATAMGNGTAASGAVATAMGNTTTASGGAATATGFRTAANGFGATALGTYSTAQAYASVAIGRFNTAVGNPNVWVDNDVLLIAGNGTSESTPSNALVLRKNGDLATTGQHTITLNSSLSRVHLNLFETENDYARLRLENDGLGYWDVAGGGTNNVELNFYSPTRGNVLSLRATGNPLTTSTGAFLSTGGTWTNNSDRALKTGFETVDADDVLTRLAALPVTRWTYTAEPGALHVGPMAQDFRAAFGLGSDERSIATVDADGVLMLAAQALEARSRAQAARIAALEVDNAALRAEIAELRTAFERGTSTSPARR